MQTVIITLEANKLANPDLDLRYLVPQRVEAVSGGQMKDNGYKYLSGGCIGIWLKAEDAQAGAETVIGLMKSELFLHNDLSATAKVYVSQQDCADIADCTCVFPNL